MKGQSKGDVSERDAGRGVKMEQAKRECLYRKRWRFSCLGHYREDDGRME